jgi:hypothetical protein
MSLLVCRRRANPDIGLALQHTVDRTDKGRAAVGMLAVGSDRTDQDFLQPVLRVSHGRKRYQHLIAKGPKLGHVTAACQTGHRASAELAQASTKHVETDAEIRRNGLACALLTCGGNLPVIDERQPLGPFHPGETCRIDAAGKQQYPHVGIQQTS